MNNLKTFISTAHISDETLLRQVCREKQSIINLGKAADYDSKELKYLLECISNRKEKNIQQYDDDQPDGGRRDDDPRHDDPRLIDDEDNSVINCPLIKYSIYILGTFGRF